MSRSSTYGFWLVFGRNGAWKTQWVTGQLLESRKHRINITNYYTGYTHIQIATAPDVIMMMKEIYSYHIFFNLLKSQKKLYTYKKQLFRKYLISWIEWLYSLDDLELMQNRDKYIAEIDDYLLRFPDINSLWENFDNLLLQLEYDWYFKEFPFKAKFNIVMDETSRMFDAREFKANFSGENKGFKDFMFELRKYGVLFYLIVQSLNILDVNFSRMALQFRAFYHGIGIWRWYRDLEFPNPEERNIETATQVGGGPIFGAILNLHPMGIKYPMYDYETEEPIFDAESIYVKGAIYPHIKNWNPPPSNIYRLFNFFTVWLVDYFGDIILEYWAKFRTKSPS